MPDVLRLWGAMANETPAQWWRGVSFSDTFSGQVAVINFQINWPKPSHSITLCSRVQIQNKLLSLELKSCMQKGHRGFMEVELTSHGLNSWHSFLIMFKLSFFFHINTILEATWTTWLVTFWRESGTCDIQGWENFEILVRWLLCVWDAA